MYRLSISGFLSTQLLRRNPAYECVNIFFFQETHEIYWLADDTLHPTYRRDPSGSYRRKFPVKQRYTHMVMIKKYIYNEIKSEVQINKHINAI